MDNFKSMYYIGLNDRYTHRQELSTAFVEGYLQSVLRNNNIDGATINLNYKGLYKYESENTILIELFNRTLPKAVTDDIKEVLNQECIGCVIVPCNIEFI